MIALETVTFMDFEASAGRDGFPIEVGWAWVEGNRVRSEAMLIAPADEWLTPAFTWDPLAELIHGLSLNTITTHGLPIAEVCRTLNEALKSRVVLFDTGADGINRYWMDLLFSEFYGTRSFLLGGPAGEFLKAMADTNGVTPDDQEALRKRAPPITKLQQMPSTTPGEMQPSQWQKISANWMGMLSALRLAWN